MGKDASTIKQEITQTRERMGDTVEALGYKADVPARMKENVQDRVDAVKGSLGDVVDNVKSAVGDAQENVKSAVGQATNAAAGTGSGNATGGSNVIAGTRDKVSSAVSKANDQIGSRLQGANVGANTQRAVGAVKENPIGLALAALAVGFLTGSLIPVSDMERRQLQPLGAKIVDQAQAATNDLVEAGKAVVAETAQSVVATALGSAQSHGHEVVDAAKSRATES